MKSEVLILELYISEFGEVPKTDFEVVGGLLVELKHLTLAKASPLYLQS